MNAERWKLIDQLMDAAFELPPDQIPQFLNEACGGDQDLRQDVERLLAADKRADRIIESRVLDGTTQTTDPETLLSALRRKINLKTRFAEGALLADRYEIIKKLGKGGMGEVWHAFDVRLRVDVALKSLRLSMQRNPTSVEHLRREVRSAREVISPNVCRIFDLVVLDQDLELISMEYIDGVTLSDLLTKSGPLELRKARDIAAQFLAGLEAIHQAGLVHRDLKPENIMITGTARVVVMDFGISERIAQMSGTAAGTLPYMSPEQISGSHIDGRSDIFAAGVVLAEMIHSRGALSEKTREMIWHAVRVDAGRIPDSPWKPMIQRAVALNREERYQTVGALVRALEEVTQRVEGIQEQKPYPGLSSFTAPDAEYFFGRELEVENFLKKIQQFPMLAIIGPSGAGKTSFLRAGFMPVLPENWCRIFTVPGDSPILNLAQSISRSVGDLSHFEDPDRAVDTFQRLRQSYKEIILLIDRFEELFTLNPPAVQSRYAEIIGRLSLEANVRVVLSMRDDFLIFCKQHDSLTPISSELTMLLPLSGAGLRRALVQPALKCGYRFEDESMVDMILSDVQNERGALPLLAFAAARLWEKRDRQNGLLTRQAYKEIGGVSGALAQYAEKILEQMNEAQQTIVREIFRNLVTAQNTRAARDWEDLLSIFVDQRREGEAENPSPLSRGRSGGGWENAKSADNLNPPLTPRFISGENSSTPSPEEVLRILIDARLLTSFDAPSGDNSGTKRRVEIIHESLLSAWPRLVRWQTQDAESAQMRDQLRQASQLWEQRGRTEDLLWTGAALQDYQAWRQHYSAKLTATEESFAQAMIQRAGRKRKQLQWIVASSFLVLLAVLAAFGLLWRNASIARDEAVIGTKRAEAGRVLAIARSLSLDPSTKLAYALRSLEFADSPEARNFAMQALSEGPTYRMANYFGMGIRFSPDGKWIAAGKAGGGMLLIPQDGGTPVTVAESGADGSQHIPWYSQFSPDGEYLLWTWRKNTSIVKVWSISKRAPVRDLQFEGLTMCFVRNGKAFFISDDAGRTGSPFYWNQCIVRVWDFRSADPEILGRVHLQGGGWKSLDVDEQGRWIAYTKGNDVFMEDLQLLGKSPARLVGTHKASARQVRFNPNGKEIGTSDAIGEIRLWSLDSSSNRKEPLRIIPGNGQPLFDFWFDPKGSSLMAPKDGSVYLWDLTAPADAAPSDMRAGFGLASIDKKQRWLAASIGTSLAVFDYEQPRFYEFRGLVPTQQTADVRFTPDGKSFLTGFTEDGISLHRIPDERFPPERERLWNHKAWTNQSLSLDVDPFGRYAVAVTEGDGVHLISLQGKDDKKLKGSSTNQTYHIVAFSPDGKSVAAKGNGIEVWDIATGISRILPNSNSPEIIRILFSPDGTLFSCDVEGNIRRWNLTTGTSSTIASSNRGYISAMAISKDGLRLAASTWKEDSSRLIIYDLQKGTESIISSHGNRVNSVAFDAQGVHLITGDADGVIRVGSVTGDTPLLLLGHRSEIGDVQVHPNGKWILSSEEENPIVRLWRMPVGKPLQSLPIAEFKNALQTMTNVRVVADQNLPAGHRTELARFPGWGISGSNHAKKK